MTVPAAVHSTLASWAPPCLAPASTPDAPATCHVSCVVTYHLHALVSHGLIHDNSTQNALFICQNMYFVRYYELSLLQTWHWKNFLVRKYLLQLQLFTCNTNVHKFSFILVFTIAALLIETLDKTEKMQRCVRNLLEYIYILAFVCCATANIINANGDTHNNFDFQLKLLFFCYQYQIFRHF